MQAAEFGRDRLRTLRPRLQARLIEVQAQECAARWEVHYQEAEAKRDESARKFARVPELSAEMIAIFRDAEESDRLVAEVNATAPPSEHRRLVSTELKARGLEHFTIADPCITKATVLPDCERSAKQAWPPPRQFDPATFAPVPYDRRYSHEWWKVSEEETRAIQAERERITAHYAAMTRQQAEREAAEAQKRGRGHRSHRS
jgi:hypothetical protein